jgi:uroporphyrinogen decarboxylase
MSDSLPLLLRAARGESVERPPVWMMRQAGRYMKIYRDLRDKYPSFRERSENPDLSYEISMQPFHAFKPDGVILFSDILTPLPGMGIDFDIIESKGPQIGDPIRSMAQVDALRPLNPAESMPLWVRCWVVSAKALATKQLSRIRWCPLDPGLPTWWRARAARTTR